MRHLILATAAILSLATTEAALAQRPQAKLLELAATGRPQPGTDSRATNYYALNGLPQQNTNAQSTQLAAGGGAHPEAETNRRSTQLAQGWHPQAHDNQSSTNV